MATEVYKPVFSLDVPGKLLEEIQGEIVTSRTAPFIDGHIPAFSVVSVDGVMKEYPGILNDRLIQISPIHRRSFELRFGDTDRLYWSDEYGNIFSTLTTKGNNLNNPRVVKNSVAPSGYIVWGLQDSDAMVRVLRASELLRANNIPTEIIVRVIEPLELPYNGRLVSLEELKGALLTQIWEQNSKSDPQKNNITRGEIPNLSLVMDKMTFYITIRGLQVSERLQDFTQSESKDGFQIMMQRVFDYVNMAEEMKARQNPLYTSIIFDIDKESDIEAYILDYLPRHIATNIARMHRLGLIHRFPHLGNISAVGGFYDLDSVKGEPLGIGDEPVTEADFARERVYIMDGEKSTNGYGLLDFIDDLAERKFLSGDLDLRVKFISNFQRAYIAERGWEDDVLGNLEKIYNFFDQFKNATPKSSLLVYYLELLSNQLGWVYDYPRDMDKMRYLYREETDEDNRRVFEQIRDNISIQDADKELIKQDNGSGILIHRNTTTVFRALEKDLRERFASELQELSIKYDQKTIDTIVSMFVLKYVARFYIEVDSDDIYDEDSFKYFQATIKQHGWEQDIVPRLQQIDELFDSYGFMPTGEKYLEYYLALLKEQTGIDFPFYDSDTQPFFDGYTEWSRENFELFLKKVVEEALPEDNLQTVIVKAYTKAGYSQDVDFSWDNWTTYVREKVSWVIEERCDSVIEAYLASRFEKEEDQDKARGDIYVILTRKAEIRLETALTADVQNQLLAKENQMELETMDKYIADVKQ